MNSYWNIVPMRRKANFLFIQFRRQTLIDWSMSLSDKNKMKRNCFDNSHKLSSFFFFWLKLIKKTWSLIVKCRSSCSWNQIKTVSSVNRRYFFFQLASGITFTLRSCCEISRVQELINVVQRVHSYYKFLKFRWVSKIKFFSANSA